MNLLSVTRNHEKQTLSLVVGIMLIGTVFLTQPLLVYYFSTMNQADNQADENVPPTFQNSQFWDAKEGYCFFYQETIAASVPASMQMVLKSLAVSPLPTQAELAAEMSTDLRHRVPWGVWYLPFNKRGYTDYINRSLSNNGDSALFDLKRSTSEKFPAIVVMWYNQTDKELGTRTEALVVTGYNQTGVFYHDPLYGPNKFMNNSNFTNLWNIYMGYWAFIIEKKTRALQ